MKSFYVMVVLLAVKTHAVSASKDLPGISHNINNDHIWLREMLTNSEADLGKSGSYIRRLLRENQWSSALVSMWVRQHVSMQECLANELPLFGKWKHLVKDVFQVRAKLEMLVLKHCISPMFKNTDAKVTEIWLEKESFFDPENNRYYGITPANIPDTAYLKKAWISFKITQ